jgi:uncharacterized LabA/DUF88 family protein
MGQTPHPSLAHLQRPAVCRVFAFIDGMNLFNAAKRCFGYQFPNCDHAKLVNAVVNMEAARQLDRATLYQGVPRQEHDADKYRWWNRKLAVTGRSGVVVERRYMARRELKITLDGIVHFEHTVPRLQEKGIDLKLGLALVRWANSRAFDVAIIFSQDGDLVEAAEEVHRIAAEQNRWVQVECAHPYSPVCDCWPINRTLQRQIPRAMYDACIDPTDYRR